MKKISTVFILLFTMNSWATDYKTCVLKEVKLQLEHKDACEMANLKKSVAKVNEAYSKCGLRTLENSPSTPDINVVNTIAKPNMMMKSKNPSMKRSSLAALKVKRQ